MLVACALVVSSLLACAPATPPPPLACTLALDATCNLQLGQTRVTLDQQTLSLERTGLPAWQTTLSGDDQFKQILGLTLPGGTARLVYSVVHCPTQCLSAEVVVLDHVEQAPPAEVFQSQQFGAGARITVLPNGDMNVVDQVFQAGDMCCPSGTSTTHFTWNGATYVAQ